MCIIPIIDTTKHAMKGCPMKNPLPSNMKNEEGFTVLELLIVIAVIGILSAIAVPVYINQRKLAVDASVTSDVRSAINQMETWNATHPYSTYVEIGPTIEVSTIIITTKGATTLQGTPLVRPPFTDIRLSSKDTKLIITSVGGYGRYSMNATNPYGKYSTAQSGGIDYKSYTALGTI